MNAISSYKLTGHQTLATWEHLRCHNSEPTAICVGLQSLRLSMHSNQFQWLKQLIHLSRCPQSILQAKRRSICQLSCIDLYWKVVNQFHVLSACFVFVVAEKTTGKCIQLITLLQLTLLVMVTHSIDCESMFCKFLYFFVFPSVLRYCWLDDRKCIWPVETYSSYLQKFSFGRPCQLWGNSR